MQNNLPLAFYRLPETQTIKVVAQKKSAVLKSGKEQASLSGFVFAPFKEDKTYSGIIIRPDIFTSADKLPKLNFADQAKKPLFTGAEKEKLKQASKRDYISYVEEIQAQIKKGKFKKVVAARVVKRKKPVDFNAVNFFKQLCKKYPGAFATLVYTPQYGLWIGATPEILLNADKQGIKTYSLAGTKANNAENLSKAWGGKEQEEQKIVSEYIIGAFKKITESKPKIKGPETIAAGNLLHLRTTFTYPQTAKTKWAQIVAQLHPTPAVAGLPKKESINFITTHEKTPRAFYSGYLGPVNLDGQINLFVNLRCMQVLKNKLAVYVGCGVTGNSKASDEWKESKMKSETLLRVL